MTSSSISHCMVSITCMLGSPYLILWAPALTKAISLLAFCAPARSSRVGTAAAGGAAGRVLSKSTPPTTLVFRPKGPGRLTRPPIFSPNIVCGISNGRPVPWSDSCPRPAHRWSSRKRPLVRLLSCRSNSPHLWTDLAGTSDDVLVPHLALGRFQLRPAFRMWLPSFLLANPRSWRARLRAKPGSILSAELVAHTSRSSSHPYHSPPISRS